MDNKPSIGTISRIIVLIIVLINQLVIAIGHKALIPGLDEDTAYESVSTILTLIVSAYTAWKNNSFTKSAIAADTYKKKLDMGLINYPDNSDSSDKD